jgi:hypothetical protein
MIERYDYVVVREPGIKPWVGQVRAIKPPRPVSRKGLALVQWADVLRDDGMTMVIPLEFLTVLQDVEVAT